MAEEKFTPKKKTYVEDIERTLYDIKDADHSVYKTQSGLTEEIIRDISKRKHDPQWMLDFRLKSLEVYNSLALPTWGPDISELNMDDIVTYVQPDAKMTGNWQEVPTDIKNTFDRLGIPEAEQARIFQRFYRSPSASEAEGVGIGLYLARQIAAGQGGYLKVSSRPGEGSTVSLFLPRAEEGT